MEPGGLLLREWILLCQTLGVCSVEEDWEPRMQPHQIEAWALNVIARVRARQPVEDDRVELKADWPQSEKVARQIAGHANAARGAPILWLLGVDEQRGTVPGVNYEELSSWWSKVEANFDELAPELLHINVPVDEATVAALFMETTRAPFVVRNPVFGSRPDPVSFEVPWRESTSVRSARRADLLRILSPLRSLPTFDFKGGDLTIVYQFRGDPDQKEEEWLQWHLDLSFYVVPQGGASCVIPFHQCSATIETSKPQLQLAMERISLRAPTSYGADPRPGSLTVESTYDEVLIHGPGRVLITASCKTEPMKSAPTGPVSVVLVMRPVGAEAPAAVQVVMPSTEPERNDWAKWETPK
jgi:hypothetical protein